MTDWSSISSNSRRWWADKQSENRRAKRYRAFAETTRYSLNSADKKTLTDVVRLCSEITNTLIRKESPMIQNQTVQISDSRRAEFNQLLDVLQKEWRQKCLNEYDTINLKLCPSFAEVEKAAPEYRVDFLIHCIDLIRGWGRNKVFNNKGSDRIHNYGTTRAAVAMALARKTLPMTEQDVQRIFAAMLDDNGLSERQADDYPLKYLINQIKKQFPNPSETLSECLKNACDRYRIFAEHLWDKKAATANLAALAELAGGSAEACFPAQDDELAQYANPQLAALPPEQQDVWSKIIALALSANAGKPSEKYLKEAKTLIDTLGADRFKKMLHGWIEFVYGNEEVRIETFTHEYRGGSYNYDTHVLPVCSINQTVLKGLVWMCSHFHDSATLSALTQLALHSYDKIPNLGARYAAMGNACFYALFRSKGLDGIASLSRLRLRIKFSNAQNAIANYLDEAAAQRGVSRNEIEDMAVDDFGLQKGCRDYDFGGYTCRLAVTGIGKSELRWFKPDGSPQKTVPAFVKTDHADKLKKLKATQKNLNTTLTA